MSEASGNIFINILATTGLGIIQEAQNQLHSAVESYRRVLQLVGDPPQPVSCETLFALVVFLPAFIGELSMCLWLLIKGVNVQQRDNGIALNTTQGEGMRA